MKQLKQLIKEVKRLKICDCYTDMRELRGIKQTVETVDIIVSEYKYRFNPNTDYKDWQKLKKLLGI